MNKPVGSSRKHQYAIWIHFLVLFFAGILASLLAINVASLPLKFSVAIVGGGIGFVALLLLGSFDRMRIVLVIAVAFGLSVSLDVSFMHNLYAPDTFVTRVGGAQAITVSLAFLGIITYALISFIEHIFKGNLNWKLRYHITLITMQLLFMVSGILTLSNALDSLSVIYEEIRLLTLLICSLVVMNMPRRHIEVLLVTIAVSVCIQTLIAGAQWATGSALGLGIFGEEQLVKESINMEVSHRATGTIGHSNILAYFYEITGPLMFAMMLWARNWWLRIIFFAAVCATAAGMLFTLSRAAWLTVPFTFSAVFVAVYRHRIWRLNTAIWVLILLLVAAIGLVYALPIILERILGDDAGSLSHRMPLNYAAWSIIEQFPMIGVGLNNFASSFGIYDTTSYSRLFLDHDHVVHNMYLLVLGEVGVLGFIPFLGLFLSSFWVALEVVKRGDSWQGAVAIGAACGLLAHMIHGLFDPGFKLNLTISQLIYVQIGIIGNLALSLPPKRDEVIVPKVFRNSSWPPKH